MDAQPIKQLEFEVLPILFFKLLFIYFMIYKYFLFILCLKNISFDIL